MLIQAAIISGLMYAISGVMGRFILRSQKDTWAYSFWFSFLGAIICLPVMVLNFDSQFSIKIVILCIILSLVVTLHNFLNFKGVGLISPSLVSSLQKTRLIWIFVFSIIFLNNKFQFNELFGVLLLIFSGFLIYLNFRDKSSAKGILFSFVSAILNAFAVIIISELLKSLDLFTTTFLVFLLPAVINLVIMPKFKERVISMIKINPKLIIITCIVSALANISMNYSLSFLNPTRTIIIIEVISITILLGEVILLKERKKIGIKLLALSLAIIASIVVNL